MSLVIYDSTLSIFELWPVTLGFGKQQYAFFIIQKQIINQETNQPMNQTRKQWFALALI